MKNSPDQLSQHLQSLMNNLQALEVQDNDPPARWTSCIQQCHNSLRNLQQSVVTQGFPDRDAEIYFFKHIKPVILGRFIYYQRIYQLYLGELKLIAQERERLLRELDAAGKELARDDFFIRYYRSGNQALDEHYFVRGNDNWFLQPVRTSFDEHFSTGGDFQLAELLSTELYMEYINCKLTQETDPASTPERKTSKRTLRCTASTSELVELGRALYLIDFFEDGNATLKAVMEHFEEMYKVDLSLHSQVGQQNDSRKEPARFLVRLIERYRRDLDDRDK